MLLQDEQNELQRARGILLMDPEGDENEENRHHPETLLPSPFPAIPVFALDAHPTAAEAREPPSVREPRRVRR